MPVRRVPITCKELIDNAKLFETGSLRYAEYEDAVYYCCPITPEDPCTLCPNGITVADDYEPHNDGFTCADVLEYYAADFDAKSASCTVGWGAYIESHCCPTVANNPCTICPDGITELAKSLFLMMEPLLTKIFSPSSLMTTGPVRVLLRRL